MKLITLATLISCKEDTQSVISSQMEDLPVKGKMHEILLYS